MAQTIVLPRRESPFSSMIPLLSQMILNKQAYMQKEQLAGIERMDKFQAEGYTIEPPETTPVTGPTPGTPGFTSNLPPPPSKPDIVLDVGGKKVGLYAPKPSITPIKAEGQIIGYGVQRGSKFEFVQPDKIAQPATAEAAAVRQYLKNNPNATADDLAKIHTQFLKPSAEQLGRVTLSDPKYVSDPSKHRTLFASDPRVKELMDQGMIEVKTPPTTVNVNMPDTITPKVKSDLQTKIVESDEALDALNQVIDPKVFKREYLEYFGEGKAKAAQYADKFGIDLANKYLGEYTGWKSLVDKQTYAYRKAVTGVAGGEREMKDIEKTYINTSKDSPVMFQAKVRVMRENAKMAKERARYSLEHFSAKSWKDLSPQEQADVAKKFPYITDVTLSKEETTNQEAEEYLRSKGF